MIIAALVAAACARHPTQFESLLNQGMIPVSSDNPYVGSNLFLAKEMERSGYLYNFMKAKGAPQAIELTGSDDTDLAATFFYAKRREMYDAKVQIDPRTKQREWIVRGPYAIDRDHYRRVTSLPMDDSAIFELWGGKERIGAATPLETRVVIAPAFVPTPPPTPKPRPKTRVIVSKPTPAPTAVPPPMNFDQRALAESRSGTGPKIEPSFPSVQPTKPAAAEPKKEEHEKTPEKSPEKSLEHEAAKPEDHASAGDVTHTVASANETLASISQKYSGSMDGTRALSERNNLPLDAKLSPGEKIVVPSSVAAKEH